MADFVWPASRATMQKAMRAGGPRFASVPFLAADAPDTLFLARGDTLVVDASTAAVAAHATSPDAIEAYLSKGVHVYSRPGLQATLLATSKTGVVMSSAYWAWPARSRGRRGCPEPVPVPTLVTDAPHAIEWIRVQVSSEAHRGVPITWFLRDWLFELWDSSSLSAGSGDHALTSVPWVEDRFPPDPTASIHFDRFDWQTGPSDDLIAPEAQELVDQVADNHRTPHFEHLWLLLQPGDPGFGVNDVVVDYDPEYGLSAPVVVVTAPRLLPDHAKGTFQIARRVRNADPEDWSELNPYYEETNWLIRLSKTVVRVSEKSTPGFMAHLFRLWHIDIPGSVRPPQLPAPVDLNRGRGRPLGTRALFPPGRYG